MTRSLYEKPSFGSWAAAMGHGAHLVFYVMLASLRRPPLPVVLHGARRESTRSAVERPSSSASTLLRLGVTS